MSNVSKSRLYQHSENDIRHCSSLHPLILDFQTPLPNLKGEGEGG